MTGYHCIQSIRAIASMLGITEYRLRKAITSLADDKHIIRRVGRGKATKYVLEMASVEMLTHLQIALDHLKRHI